MTAVRPARAHPRAGDRLAPKPLRLVLNWGRRYSLWVFNFGLACCSIEFIAPSMARHDFIRLGVIPFAPGPRQADLMVVSGTVTDKMAPAVKRLYDQMPEPKYVISFGACANSGGPYWDSYCVTKGVDQIIPVDVYVPGCPPRPEALLQGILVLQAKIAGELARRPVRRPPRPRPGAAASARRAAGAAAPDRRVSALADAAAAGRCGEAVLAVDAGFGPPTVDVAAASWVAALAPLRGAGATYFDFLSAYDELEDGLRARRPRQHAGRLRPRAAADPGAARRRGRRHRDRGVPRRVLARARDPRDVRDRLHRPPPPGAAAAARRLRRAAAAQGLRARLPRREGLARGEGARRAGRRRDQAAPDHAAGRPEDWAQDPVGGEPQ